MSSTQVIKDERLALRMTHLQKQLIERAAKIRGSSVSDFSVMATVDRAEQVLLDQTDLVLDEAAWQVFNEALNHPAQVMPKLRDMMTQPSVFA